MTAIYDAEFYANRNAATQYAAERILGLALEHLPPIASAIDIGCGVGTWLNTLRSRGVSDITGVEGPWVKDLDAKALAIPASNFLHRKLDTDGVNVQRKFDLAICLEVAEHIPPRRASAFIAEISHCSDSVLFSAAIPGQGGNGHVNEQWPAYWADIFSMFGFVGGDVLRSQVWSDTKIPWWYRQNVMLFTRQPIEAAGDWKLSPLVHPECFRPYTEYYVGRELLRLKKAVKNAFARRWKSTQPETDWNPKVDESQFHMANLEKFGE
jgi:methyltransferase family protein